MDFVIESIGLIWQFYVFELGIGYLDSRIAGAF